MCDLEKRGERFVSRFQPNPIRSEEKGALLSLAKGYRVRDWRALPRLNAYALLAEQKETRCGHGHSRDSLRAEPSRARDGDRARRSRSLDSPSGRARSSPIFEVSGPSVYRERVQSQPAATYEGRI